MQSAPAVFPQTLINQLRNPLIPAESHTTEPGPQPFPLPVDLKPIVALASSGLGASKFLRNQLAIPQLRAGGSLLYLDATPRFDDTQCMACAATSGGGSYAQGILTGTPIDLDWLEKMLQGHSGVVFAAKDFTRPQSTQSTLDGIAGLLSRWKSPPSSDSRPPLMVIVENPVLMLSDAWLDVVSNAHSRGIQFVLRDASAAMWGFTPLGLRLGQDVGTLALFAGKTSGANQAGQTLASEIYGKSIGQTVARRLHTLQPDQACVVSRATVCTLNA